MLLEHIICFHEVEFGKIDLCVRHHCIQFVDFILLFDVPVKSIIIDTLEIIGFTLTDSTHRLATEVKPGWIKV